MIKERRANFIGETLTARGQESDEETSDIAYQSEAFSKSCGFQRDNVRNLYGAYD